MKHMRPSPVLSLLLLIATLPLIAAPTSNNRPTVALTENVLELDGTIMGTLYNAEGGNPYGEVVNEKIGPDRIQRKHVAGLRYEDLTLTCGTGMAPELYDWIKETLNGNSTPKNGAVVMVDYNGQVINRLVFYNAIIKEVSFPVFDASSKDAGKITLKLSCGYTQRNYSGGPLSSKPSFHQQKIWLLANFRLNIAGLDAAVARASKIEAITITQRTALNSVGKAKEYSVEPTLFEVSNLTVTVPDAYADSFRNWMDDFVVKGNHNLEKTGTLEVLTPNNQNVLFTLTLSNLGIFKLTPDQTEAGKTGIRKIKADMYCEDVDFIYMEEMKTSENTSVSG